MHPDISAIILAAGKGKRFGEPKAFAKIDNMSFLDLSISKLCSLNIAEILVVVKEKINLNFNNIKQVINIRHNAPMLSSIYEGIKNSDMKTSGYMIYPVDYPYIGKDTLERLINAYSRNTDKVIMPIYQGMSGHPVIIPASLADKINDVELEGGLGALIKNSHIEVEYIEVPDEGILKNINYKSDLK